MASDEEQRVEATFCDLNCVFEIPPHESPFVTIGLRYGVCENTTSVQIAYRDLDGDESADAIVRVGCLGAGSGGGGFWIMLRHGDAYEVAGHVVARTLHIVESNDVLEGFPEYQSSGSLFSPLHANRGMPRHEFFVVDNGGGSVVELRATSPLGLAEVLGGSGDWLQDEELRLGIGNFPIEEAED